MSEVLVHEVDLCVIGAGPGGYVAAIAAAKRGLSVILCEKDKIGGTCLNVGCIPTKALIHAADLYTAHKEAKAWGVDYAPPALDMGRMIDKKNQIVRTLTDGIAQLLRHHGVRILSGVASFEDDSTVVVAGDPVAKIRAKHVIIASGSKTKQLPIPGIDLEGVVDSTGLLEVRDVPKRLAVIGGGVIGMEFAFLFGRLGSQVKVLEFLPSILSSFDKDLSARLIPHAKRVGVSVQTQAAVQAIVRTERGLIVRYLHQGEILETEADLVLQAVGRVSDVSSLHLERTAIAHTKQGIVVDSHYETNVKGVYAIGDVNGLWQLAHAASHQALHVVDKMLGTAKHQPDFVPSVVYTTPPIASVGLTETEAAKQTRSVRIVKVPYGANGKALIQDGAAGFVKLIVAADTASVLGAQVFGVDADHLIASLTYLLTLGANEAAVRDAIVAHPSVEELIHEAYLGIEGLAIHYLDR
jgi:dihydrolipoamide dehydrogenase